MHTHNLIIQYRNHFRYINTCIHPLFHFNAQSMKTLIRTRRRDATAERGACFHPTIGSVTPNGFTTGHPRARPRCSERESFLPAQQQLGTEVTLLLPQDLGNGFSLYTKQGGLPEYFLSHSTPSFISLYHNPASHILRPEHTFFFSSSSNLRA
jgi:hypothetical protein